MPPTLHIIDDPEHAACMLSAIRVRILTALREPNSASGLAQQLAEPRQKLNYHIRQLEESGLVKQVGTRQARGFTENLMQSAANAFLIGPAALGPMACDPKDIQDQASSAYLAASAAAVVDDVARLRTAAGAEGKRVATMTLASQVRFKSADDQRAFADRLTECVASLISEFHCDGGRAFNLFTGFYQTPQNQDRDDHDQA